MWAVSNCDGDCGRRTAANDDRAMQVADARHVRWQTGEKNGTERVEPSPRAPPGAVFAMCDYARELDCALASDPSSCHEVWIHGRTERCLQPCFAKFFSNFGCTTAVYNLIRHAWHYRKFHEARWYVWPSLTLFERVRICPDALHSQILSSVFRVSRLRDWSWIGDCRIVRDELIGRWVLVYMYLVGV